MATLSTIPVELCLDILELLKPQEFNAPVVGVNGGWTKLTTVVKLPADEGQPASHYAEPWRTAFGSKGDGRIDPSALWNLRR
jgi:hypothetical protein